MFCFQLHHQTTLREGREELLVNYTDIPLNAAMREIGWKGKNFVPYRIHPNKVDVSAGVEVGLFLPAEGGRGGGRKMRTPGRKGYSKTGC